jgi:hypothetical protein
MIEVQEKLQSLANYCMGFFAFNVHNEPDATGLMFELWIVQTLFARRSVSGRRMTLPALPSAAHFSGEPRLRSDSD